MSKLISMCYSLYIFHHTKCTAAGPSIICVTGPTRGSTAGQWLPAAAQLAPCDGTVRWRRPHERLSPAGHAPARQSQCRVRRQAAQRLLGLRGVFHWDPGGPGFCPIPT
eukprot:481539-Hanusia_phi.AAC.1